MAEATPDHVATVDFDRHNEVAIRGAGAADRIEPRANAVMYDPGRELILVELRSGHVFGFPPGLVAGLRGAGRRAALAGAHLAERRRTPLGRPGGECIVDGPRRSGVEPSRVGASHHGADAQRGEGQGRPEKRDEGWTPTRRKHLVEVDSTVASPLRVDAKSPTQ